MKKGFIVLNVLILVLFFAVPHTLAAGYQPLSPIPGATEATGTTSSGDLSGYLKALYNFGIGLAAGLAVLMVIWGGVEYMTTDAIGHQEEGKNKIQNAIMGLLLALSSYIILQTINKDLLKLDFNPDLNPVDAQGKATQEQLDAAKNALTQAKSNLTDAQNKLAETKAAYDIALAKSNANLSDQTLWQQANDAAVAYDNAKINYNAAVRQANYAETVYTSAYKN